MTETNTPDKNGFSVGLSTKSLSILAALVFLALLGWLGWHYLNPSNSDKTTSSWNTNLCRYGDEQKSPPPCENKKPDEKPAPPYHASAKRPTPQPPPPVYYPPTPTYPQPSCSITAAPSTVGYGGSVILNWNVNGLSANVTDFGAVPAGSGYRSLNNLYSTRTYSMTVYGQGGTSANCSTTVYVQPQTYYPPPPTYPQPSCSIWAEPATVNFGGSSVLRWSTSNTSSVRLHDYGSVSVGSGYQPVNNLMSNRTYEMTVQGENGTSANCSVTVSVVQPQVQSTVYIPGAAPSLNSQGMYVPPVITSGSNQNQIYIPGQAPGVTGQTTTYTSGGGPSLDNGGAMVLPAGGTSHTPVY